jgi:hypothetical protein
MKNEEMRALQDEELKVLDDDEDVEEGEVDDELSEMKPGIYMYICVYRYVYMSFRWVVLMWIGWRVGVLHRNYQSL